MVIKDKKEFLGSSPSLPNPQKKGRKKSKSAPNNLIPVNSGVTDIVLMPAGSIILVHSVALKWPHE